MKFLSGYNIKVVVQWGEFSVRGWGLPLISSVGRPWDRYNFGGGVYTLNIYIDFKSPHLFI